MGNYLVKKISVIFLSFLFLSFLFFLFFQPVVLIISFPSIKLITKTEVKKELSSLNSLKKIFKDATLEQSSANQIIDHLIKRKVIEILSKRYKISVTKGDINTEFEKIISAYDYDKFAKVLADYYGLSIEDFKMRLRTKLLERKLKEKVTLKIRAKHILVKEKEEAEELINQIKKGADFSDLAKRHSLDLATKDLGGDLGYLSKGKMEEKFEEVVFSLNPGELGIVETELGWHLIKVEDKIGFVEDFDKWIKEERNKMRIILFPF